MSHSGPAATAPGLASAAFVGVTALVLALSALLPQPQAWCAALVIVIALGVPHGALDGEIARPLLRPHFGRAWFMVFTIPYLSLSGAVLVAWRLAPLATLAAFLAASMLHFGEEDAGPHRPLERLVRGGLPIALPTLLHPAVTAGVFAATALTPLPALPDWLVIAARVWLALALPMLALWLARRRWAVLVEIAGLGLAFWLLPPLTAFALYFVGLHAPRHMAALAADPVRGPRVDSMRAAICRSLPVTGLTVLLGALLWRWFPGPPVDRLLAITLQGLAALTLPHLLLDWRASKLATSNATSSLPVSTCGSGTPMVTLANCERLAKSGSGFLDGPVGGYRRPVARR